MIPSTASFVLHIFVESAAAISFILDPQAQLPGASPAATLILRQYGGLLLSTNFICAALAARPFDLTIRLICGSFAFFHLWPMYRAYSRVNNPELYDKDGKHGTPPPLGGPKAHLAAHVLCCLLFTASAMTTTHR